MISTHRIDWTNANRTVAVALLVANLLWFEIPLVAGAEIHDIALTGGLVIDPETGLSAVRNVGIQGNRIAAVSQGEIAAKRHIDVSGLVVAPGFIDLHSHGQNNASNKLQALDGVTTALDLEFGTYPLGAWYETRRGHAVLNYGASISHMNVRARILHLFDPGYLFGRGYRAASGLRAMRRAQLSPERLAEMSSLIEAELSNGSLGIGVAAQYIPGMTPLEEATIFELAAKYNSIVFVHTKYAGIEAPHNGVNAIIELLDLARRSNAGLHIAHITGVALGDTPRAIKLILEAQSSGVVVSTEAYPYGAAGTSISSAYFDAGWKKRYGIDYADIMLVKTGETLTAETFEAARRHGGFVIVNSIPQSAIESALRVPSIVMASDALPFGKEGRGHPRATGTFARVLGHYVREQSVLSLDEAIKKMTLIPAQILGRVSPQMLRKGRLQVGADADITVFDPRSVIDRATYESPTRPSQGIEYVIVNGKILVEAGEFIENRFPGQPVYGR